MAGFREVFLHARLLEEVRHIAVLAEVYHSFGADNVLGPAARYEIVELVEFERTAAEIYECGDAVFFGFPFVVMMVVVMVSMLMFAVLIMFMFMMMFVMMVFMFFCVRHVALYSLYPGG